MVTTFHVTDAEAGERLDRVVIGRIAGLGRKRASELFAEGRVQVNGRRAAKGEAAIAATEIVVSLEDVQEVPSEPDAPLVVTLERDDLVIVEKPAGQPSAPLRGESGTLAGALLGRYPEMTHVGWSRREPGLLHRLDTHTSGLLVAARAPHTFERLRRALTAGQIEKRYLAITHGRGLPDVGTIESGLAADRGDRRRVLVVEDAEPRRTTRFTVLRREAEWALVELRVSRAYRHQIRAHLAHIGHPIAGDAVYGGPPAAALGQRHALHASYIAWAGDATVVGFEAEARLPADMGILMPG